MYVLLYVVITHMVKNSGGGNFGESGKQSVICQKLPSWNSGTIDLPKFYPSKILHYTLNNQVRSKLSSYLCIS